MLSETAGTVRVRCTVVVQQPPPPRGAGAPGGAAPSAKARRAKSTFAADLVADLTKRGLFHVGDAAQLSAFESRFDVENRQDKTAKQRAQASARARARARERERARRSRFARSR